MRFLGTNFLHRTNPFKDLTSGTNFSAQGIPTGKNTTLGISPGIDRKSRNLELELGHTRCI